MILELRRIHSVAGIALVALLSSTLPAADAVTISPAIKDADGLIQHAVVSPYQPGETDIRVLLPDQLEAGAKLPVVYVLPVEARGRNKFGDGLIEVRKRNLHNKHRAVYVAPSFQQWPWYGDHPTDAKVRQETYFLEVVLPFIEKTYPVSSQRKDHHLVGFSKSGWGAWSLLLRHPERFGRAAAWDSPMMMPNCDRYGTQDVFADQETFEKYRLPDAVRSRAANLGKEPRLILTGYGGFREHHHQMHDLLDSLHAPHIYRDGPAFKHDWHSGWIAEALDLLFAETPKTASASTAEVPAYEWKQVSAKAPFAPRDGAGAVVHRGRMWFLGGWNPGDKE
ncbi:MAG: alpha/beta hydrolase-fold protein, partial [Planctomycetaceae bacterium]